jgi:Kef-type K+ transport system membrane component KefB
MLLEAVWIGFAFSIGMLVRFAGLPSLVGYLAAGFAISTVSVDLGLPAESSAVLEHVAHIGVLLLLFSVGLKLNLRNLV